MYLQFPMEEKTINKVKAYFSHELPSRGKINLTSLGAESSVVFIGFSFHHCNYEAALIL